MRRPRFLDYYRQFEELSPEENSRRLRRRRDEQRAAELELAPELDVSRSEWHGPPDPEIVNAATFALRRALNRYPDRDATVAREAVAAHHDVDASQVAVGHGAAQLLQGILRHTALEAKVLLPWPSWSPLPGLISRAGSQPVPVGLERGAPDLSALSAAVDEGVRAVLLCSPNDPTGTISDPAEMRSFAAGLPEHVLLLVDEALIDFAGEECSALDLVHDLPNTIVLRSLSKAWALAGLRVGYAIGPHGLEDLLAGIGPGLGVSSPALAALVSAMEASPRMRERLEQRRAGVAAERERLARLLADTPFRAPPSRAHVVWLSGDGHTSASLTAGLAGQRVRVAPGTAWNDPDHVRVTLRDRSATERLASALRSVAAS